MVGFAVSLSFAQFMMPRLLHNDWIFTLLNHEQRGFLWSLTSWFPVILLVSIFLGLSIIGWVKYKKHDSSFFKPVGCSAVILVLLAFLWPEIIGGEPGKSTDAEVKSNAHTIQITLEIYAEDHNGYFPESICELLEGYLKRFPVNEYKGGTMKNVSYGAPDVGGNFTYLPVKVGEKVAGYYLLVYGRWEGPSLMSDDQPDHVILVLQSREDNPAWPPDTPFPSVKDVILSSQR
jgi:hypothetical protein